MYEITQKPAHADNFAPGRNGKLPGWIVCHRMVGYLTGTDRHFAKAGVQTSTHFGIGRRYAGGPVEISQYVALDDRAYGNGNNVDRYGREVRSDWNRLGFPSRPNEHTISIEHEDGALSVDANGKRGVVDDAVIDASIWLIGLLLTGDPVKVRAAGIRYRDADIVRALGTIDPVATRIIDHHFIAGPLKPYCWQPWYDDKGFPQARYLAALQEDEPDMPGLDLRPIGQLVAGVADVPAGTEVIFSKDRRRAVTTDDATNRQATGLYERAETSGIQSGYEVLFADGRAWVNSDDVSFSPVGDPAPAEYAVIVGGKNVGKVTLP